MFRTKSFSLDFHVCRTAWVQKIKAASELFIETEKKKREKAYLGVYSFFIPNLCTLNFSSW